MKSSTLSFAEIDAAREKAGITILELSRRARLAPSTYWFIRQGKTQPRAGTLRRYEAALKGPIEPPGVSDHVRSLYRAHLAHTAKALGFDAAQALERPQAREFWQARAVALAWVAADLDLPHAEIGRALGLSKQIVNWNIKQALALADEPKLAWFFELVGQRGSA